MSLDEKIKTRRKELNLTQEELCEKITEIPRSGDNLTRQAISKWETGTGYPDYFNLIALSVILDISLDDLCADDIQYIKGVIKKEPEIFEKYPGIASGLKLMSEVLKKI